MALKDVITADMKSAMKNRENATLSTLRLLRSEIKNQEIKVQHELVDEEVISVIKTQVKQLKDSIEMFRAGGREELASNSEKEISVLTAYLPNEITDDELEIVIKQAIETAGITSKADIGKAMGVAMKLVAGRADGKRVKDAVTRLLPVLIIFGIASIAEPAYAQIPMLTDTTNAYSELELILRVFRVLLLWGGVFAINSILHGGFGYMISSMRDNAHSKALQKITSGFIGSVVVIGLFSITTVFIEIL